MLREQIPGGEKNTKTSAVTVWVLLKCLVQHLLGSHLTYRQGDRYWGVGVGASFLLTTYFPSETEFHPGLHKEIDSSFIQLFSSLNNNILKSPFDFQSSLETKFTLKKKKELVGGIKNKK